MKVIAINGSPRKDSNTLHVLRAMKTELSKEQIDVEIVDVGNQLIHGCIACGYCSSSENNLCVFKNDLVNETALKMRDADGIILSSPTYYASISGTMKSFLDRIFYTSSSYFKYKVGSCISIARRAGGVDVTYQLNSYFQLAKMIVTPTQYWPIVYGTTPGQVLQDTEGMQTATQSAKDMAWLLKVLNQGKQTFPLPPEDERARMNFIR